MDSSFRASQAAALARHAATGQPHCVVDDQLTGGTHVLPEDAVIRTGLIDSILWSSDTSDCDEIDPALRA